MSFQLLSDNIYWNRFCYCLFIFRFHKQNSQPSLWSVVWWTEAYYHSYVVLLHFAMIFWMHMNAESALNSCMKYYIKRALRTRKCFVALPIFLLVIHIGIDVDISTGIAKCRAIVVVCTADLLAHALLVNMKSFSGEYSCPTCTDRG